MGVASLVLGIISVVVSLFGGFFNWVGAVVGIIGIVLGALGRRNEASKGLATAGLVLSILGTIFGLLFWIACSVILSSF